MPQGLSGVNSVELQSRAVHWQQFKGGDFEQKWNSSKSIVRQGKAAIAPLLELLNDPTADVETHWFTIRALGHFPNPDVIAAIANQIDNTTHANRSPEQVNELSAFAIETLAAMGTVAIDVLGRLLQQPQRRLLAAKALNQVRSSGVIPVLIQVADDGDPQVRFYAIDALGSFHDPTITPVLLAALQDPVSNVRKAAVMALGRRADLQTTHNLSQQLEPLLWDFDLAVSCQVALALGRLGAEDALPSLQQVLMSDHTPPLLRIDAIRALTWFCDRDHSPSQNAFDILHQALMAFGFPADREPSPEVSPEMCPDTSPETIKVLLALIQGLGELHHSPLVEPAAQTLIAYLKTSPQQTELLRATIMALADLAQPQVFDALLPLLTHPVELIPMHTIAALKRLDPSHGRSRMMAALTPESQALILDLW